jgi:auxin responsive GH3 family protein
VIEISGFDPIEGHPIVQFIERRSVVIQFPDFMVTEKELRATMSSVAKNMVNWTAVIDDRRVPSTIGFFVEPASDQVSDLALAPNHVFDELLQSNESITWAFEHGKVGKPTIRLVRSGTFSDFLQLKLDEGSNNLGQIKVPVVLPKAEYVAWFSERVLQEL